MIHSYRSASAIARFIVRLGTLLRFISVLTGLLVATAFHDWLGRIACVTIGLAVTITLFLIGLAFAAIGNTARAKLVLADARSKSEDATSAVVPIGESSKVGTNLHAG